MATLTKQQRRELQYILGNLMKAQAYIRKDRTVVGLKYPAPDGAKGGTTLDYRRADGAMVAELDKEIGSDLACLHTAVRDLSRFLNPPVVRPEIPGVEFVDGDAKLNS